MKAKWLWAGACSVGTSHLKNGLPCQDNFACRVWQREGDPPVLIAALADGAGSAEKAEVGSRFATSIFAEIVCEALDDGHGLQAIEGTLRYAIGETKYALQVKAENEGRDPNDFASTFIGAILTPTGGALGQIGDGAIVIQDNGTDWRPVFWPDHGEYANTTCFLTQRDAMHHLRVATLETPVQCLAMFSDGLERLVLNFRDRTAHASFFDSMFMRMTPGRASSHLADISADLAVFLDSDKVNARTDDDKSLLCAALLGA